MPPSQRPRSELAVRRPQSLCVQRSRRLLWQCSYFGNQCVPATKLGSDQFLCLLATGGYELFAKPSDDNINRAFANAALRAVKQFRDFAAGTQNPRLRQKVRQQAAFRTRQIDAEAVLCGELIAFGAEVHSGEGEISPVLFAMALLPPLTR